MGSEELGSAASALRVNGDVGSPLPPPTLGCGGESAGVGARFEGGKLK